MKRHRGFTLIEMTVVLTVLSLVWLSITCALYKLHRADLRLHDELQRERASDRLAMRLRLDAHAATSARLTESAEGGSELVLSTIDDHSIHYGMSDDGVYRVVRQGEAVVHRDMFLIGRSTIDWELTSPPDRSLIVVTFTAHNARSPAIRIRRIKAALTSVTANVPEAAETSL